MFQPLQVPGGPEGKVSAWAPRWQLVKWQWLFILVSMGDDGSISLELAYL